MGVNIILVKNLGNFNSCICMWVKVQTRNKRLCEGLHMVAERCHQM